MAITLGVGTALARLQRERIDDREAFLTVSLAWLPSPWSARYRCSMRRPASSPPPSTRCSRDERHHHHRRDRYPGLRRPLAGTADVAAGPPVARRPRRPVARDGRALAALGRRRTARGDGDADRECDKAYARHRGYGAHPGVAVSRSDSCCGGYSVRAGSERPRPEDDPLRRDCSCVHRHRDGWLLPTGREHLRVLPARPVGGDAVHDRRRNELRPAVRARSGDTDRRRRARSPRLRGDSGVGTLLIGGLLVLDGIHRRRRSDGSPRRLPDRRHRHDDGLRLQRTSAPGRPAQRTSSS